MSVAMLSHSSSLMHQPMSDCAAVMDSAAQGSVDTHVITPAGAAAGRASTEHMDLSTCLEYQWELPQGAIGSGWTGSSTNSSISDFRGDGVLVTDDSDLYGAAPEVGSLEDMLLHHQKRLQHPWQDDAAVTDQSENPAARIKPSAGLRGLSFSGWQHDQTCIHHVCSPSSPPQQQQDLHRWVVKAAAAPPQTQGQQHDQLSNPTVAQHARVAPEHDAGNPANHVGFLAAEHSVPSPAAVANTHVSSFSDIAAISKAVGARALRDSHLPGTPLVKETGPTPTAVRLPSSASPASSQMRSSSSNVPAAKSPAAGGSSKVAVAGILPGSAERRGPAVGTCNSSSPLYPRLQPPQSPRPSLQFSGPALAAAASNFAAVASSSTGGSSSSSGNGSNKDKVAESSPLPHCLASGCVSPKGQLLCQQLMMKDGVDKADNMKFGVGNAEGSAAIVSMDSTAGNPAGVGLTEHLARPMAFSSTDSSIGNMRRSRSNPAGQSAALMAAAAAARCGPAAAAGAAAAAAVGVAGAMQQEMGLTRQGSGGIAASFCIRPVARDISQSLHYCHDLPPFLRGPAGAQQQQQQQQQQPQSWQQSYRASGGSKRPGVHSSGNSSACIAAMAGLGLLDVQHALSGGRGPSVAGSRCSMPVGSPAAAAAASPRSPHPPSVPAVPAASPGSRGQGEEGDTGGTVQHAGAEGCAAARHVGGPVSLPRCGSAAAGMSPAPPLVPQSPQQQHATSIRVRRSGTHISTSPCPSPGRGPQGTGPWFPKTRTPQPHVMTPRAAAAAAAGGILADDAPLSELPDSPGASCFGPLPDKSAAYDEGGEARRAGGLGGRVGIVRRASADTCTLRPSALQQEIAWPALSPLRLQVPAAGMPQQQRQLLRSSAASGSSNVQSQQQQQQQHGVQTMHRSCSLESGIQLPGQPGHQQPVPPKANAPLCRSPCVSRIQASPATPGAPAAPGWPALLMGGGHPCSPVLEVSPSSTKSCSSNGNATPFKVQQEQPKVVFAPHPPSSCASAPEVTPPTSAPGLSRASLLHGSGGNSSGSACSSSRLSSKGALAMLPPPVFEQPQLKKALLMQAQEEQQQQQQQDAGLLHAYTDGSCGRLLPAGTAAGAVHSITSSMSRSLSGSLGHVALPQQHKHLPHPPASAMHAGWTSPRPSTMFASAAGAAPLPAGSGGAGGQPVPVPPIISLPSAPSPAVKARVLNIHTSSNNSSSSSTAGAALLSVAALQQQMYPSYSAFAELETPRDHCIARSSSSNNYLLGEGSSVWPVPSAALCAAAVAAEAERALQGPGDVLQQQGKLQLPPKRWQLPHGLAVPSGTAAADRGVPPLTEGAAAAAAAALEASAAAQQHSAGELSEARTSAPAVDGALLDLDIIPEPSATSTGSCDTPHVEWGAAGAAGAEAEAACTNSCSGSAAESAQAIEGGTPDICSRATGADTGSSSSSSSSVPCPGCPGWDRPVVVAFGHYRNRLGYLMSSGIVGVVFEDSTHMFMRPEDGWACYLDSGSSSKAAAAAPGAARQMPPQDADCSNASPCRDQDCDTPPPGPRAGSVFSCASSIQQQPSPAVDTSSGSSSTGGKAKGLSRLSDAPDQGASVGLTHKAGTVVFRLPQESSPGHSSADSCDGSSSASNHGSHNAAKDGSSGASVVPRHLLSKSRCIKRFAGCLVHQLPYNHLCQLDITRLPFRAASGAAAAAATGSVELQQSLTAAEVAAERRQVSNGQQRLDPGVPHLRRFVHRDGCLLLKLSDGCQQLVFTSDRSVLLLDPSCRCLALVTSSKPRSNSGSQQASPAGHVGLSAAAAAVPGAAAAAAEGVQGAASVSAPGSDKGGASGPPAGRAASVRVVHLSLDRGAAVPCDAGLLRRLLFAARLVKGLHLPGSWVQAAAADGASPPLPQG